MRHTQARGLVIRYTLVTGGSGKIGAALVIGLLRQGHHVAATGSRETSLAALRQRVGGDNRLLTIQSNLLQDQAVPELLEALGRSGFRPDGLVNAARSLEFLAPDASGRISRDNFVGEMLMDVVIPYELTMALASSEGSRLRSVVNVGSMYGSVAPTPALYGGTLTRSPINYGVAKAALLHLTKELAVRLAPRVRVNAVSFGGVEGRTDEIFKQRYASLCPSGSMLDETDTVGPIAFLLGDESISMTGANLLADGGWTLW